MRQHVLITDDEPGQPAFYQALGFNAWGEDDLASGRTFVRFI